MSTPAYPPAVAGILEHNRAFVASGAWADHAAPGRPTKQVAVLTCMDTRLTRLLPDALGLANGHAKIIKVAGATIVEPYGEAMRSLLVAVAELGVTDILVVGHTNCGTCGMQADHMLDELARAGVPRERIEAAVHADPRAATFLNGFESLPGEVAASVRKIREHPLMPPHVRVWGFTIDIETGELVPVDPSLAADVGPAPANPSAAAADVGPAPANPSAAAADVGSAPAGSSAIAESGTAPSRTCGHSS